MTSITAKTSSSYQRLKQETWFEEEEDYNHIREKVIGSLRSTSRFRSSRSFHIKRRLKVKIPSLSRFFRRKARLIKLAWFKVYKRLKESRSHFNDLFAGNYLFMQVNPVSLKSYASATGNMINNGVSNNNNTNKSAGFVRSTNQLRGLSANYPRIN